jgi:hypothetical protein
MEEPLRCYQYVFQQQRLHANDVHLHMIIRVLLKNSTGFESGGTRKQVHSLLFVCDLHQGGSSENSKNLRLVSEAMANRCTESIAQIDGWAQCTNTRSSRKASATVNALSRTYTARRLPCRIYLRLVPLMKTL